MEFFLKIKFSIRFLFFFYKTHLFCSQTEIFKIRKAKILYSDFSVYKKKRNLAMKNRQNITTNNI